MFVIAGATGNTGSVVVGTLPSAPCRGLYHKSLKINALCRAHQDVHRNGTAL